MAKFAPVVPITIARILRDHNVLGDYHLLLAHDVVQHPLEYAEVYKQITADGGFIIMDNSVIELGKAVDSKIIQEACDIVNASCVVLPDVLMDGPQTFAHTTMEFKSWQSQGFDFDAYAPMIIPQGHSFEDWITCAEHFAQSELGPLAYVGLARNIREKHKVSRAVAAGWAVHMFEQELHMFGFSDDLRDDILTCQAFPEIMGIDSAVPARMATQGMFMHLDQLDPGPRGNWWDTVQHQKLDPRTVVLLKENLKFIRDEINLE